MKIQINKERAATANDNRYAAAKIGFVPNGDRSAMATEARKAGMTRVALGQYQGKDNSWIMMADDGRIERGRGDTKWIGVPSRVANNGAVASSGGRAGSYTVDHMLKTALGKLPMLSGSEGHDATTLRQHGFTARGQVYRHRDGSAVDYTSGYGRLSYKGTDLSLLPRWW